MKIIFFIFGLIAIFTTIKAVTHINPIYALLHLIISIFSSSMIFFNFGSDFAGALEIIIYAGSIMVLFIFTIMLISFNKSKQNQKRMHLKFKDWLIPAIISIILINIMIYSILIENNGEIAYKLIKIKEIGINLFGPYILVVELISFLLLSSLVVSFHFGKNIKRRKM